MGCLFTKDQVRARAPLRVAVVQPTRKYPDETNLRYHNERCQAHRRVPSPPPGTTPSPDRGCADAFTSAGWGGGSWWACWPDTFWLTGGGRSSCSLSPLSPSRPSGTCVCVGPPAAGSGRTRPASPCGPQAARRPADTYPSHIRVERAATRGARAAGGRGACCPAATGAAPGQVCAAGPCRAGGLDQISVNVAPATRVRTDNSDNFVSVEFIFEAPLACTLY